MDANTNSKHVPWLPSSLCPLEDTASTFGGCSTENTPQLKTVLNGVQEFNAAAFRK